MVASGVFWRSEPLHICETGPGVPGATVLNASKTQCDIHPRHRPRNEFEFTSNTSCVVLSLVDQTVPNASLNVPRGCRLPFWRIDAGEWLSTQMTDSYCGRGIFSLRHSMDGNNTVTAVASVILGNAFFGVVFYAFRRSRGDSYPYQTPSA